VTNPLRIVFPHTTRGSKAKPAKGLSIGHRARQAVLSVKSDVERSLEAPRAQHGANGAKELLVRNGVTGVLHEEHRWRDKPPADS